MKKNIFVVSTNIISPLGITGEQNFMQMEKGISGIQLHNNTDVWSEEFHASLFDKDFKNFTFEDIVVSHENQSIN